MAISNNFKKEKKKERTQLNTPPKVSQTCSVFDMDMTAQMKYSCFLAKELLYLHEVSWIKVTHRDLKPSNVLLNHDMVDKILDLCKDLLCVCIFSSCFLIDYNNNNNFGTQNNGYMAPMYAMEGLLSVKLVVFSFGVILLEIISMKSNNGFYLAQHAPTLLAYGHFYILLN